MQIVSGNINDTNYHLFDKVIDTVYSTISDAKALVQKVNPHLAEKYFVVLKDGSPVARLMKYNNPEIQIKNKTTDIFGNFESINDPEVVKFLFDNFEKNAVSSTVIGPISGSTWNDYRISLASSNKIFFSEFVCMPYYQSLLNEAGYETFSKYRSFISKNYNYKADTIRHFTDHFAAMNIYIRRINMNDFENELIRIYESSVEGFKNNLFYSDISQDEFLEKYRQLKPIIDPDFIFLAMEDENKCVGFGMSLHNFYNKEIKQLIMKSAARLPYEKYKGLGTLFNELTKRTALEKGYEELIQAFVINDSVSEKSFAHANNSETYREYELLIKTLE